MTITEFNTMPAPKRKKLFLRVAAGANKRQKALVIKVQKHLKTAKK